MFYMAKERIISSRIDIINTRDCRAGFSNFIVNSFTAASSALTAKSQVREVPGQADNGSRRQRGMMGL